MSNTSFWLSIIVNGGFALYFFNRLISTDYEEYHKYVYYVDGSALSLNLAAFLHTIWR